MKENDYRFGNFICQLREEQGMTQAELAKKMGVTAAAVSKWENGESKPRMEKLFELADILGVSAEELMRGERKPLTLPTISYNTNALPSNDTRFRRIGAFFLDVLISEFVGIMTLPLFFAVFHDKINLFRNLTFSVSVTALLMMIFRDFIFNGKSLGKRITRMTVANAADGSRPKWYKLILRNLPYFIYFIDFFVLIINGRSLGDMLTDTFTPLYVKHKNVYGQTITPNHTLAQSYITPQKKKRKVFIIVTCVVIGITLFFAIVFTIGFGCAKQSKNYPAAIEHLISDERLSAYDNLTESDFILHSYSFSGIRSDSGTWYESFGFWVKGQDLYVTFRSVDGEVRVYNTR